MFNKRNEPCFCGSGKKYKKCHLVIEYEENDPRKPKGKLVFSLFAGIALMVVIFFSQIALHSTFSGELLVFVSIGLSFFLCSFVFKSELYFKCVTFRFKIDSVSSLFLKGGLILLLATPIININHMFSYAKPRYVQAIIINKEKNSRFGTYELELELGREKVSFYVDKDTWVNHKKNNQVKLIIQRGVLGFNVIKDLSLIHI